MSAHAPIELPFIHLAPWPPPSLEMDHCPLCDQDLPVNKFGKCVARKSGRNLYCKDCIREKVRESRRTLKAYQSARRRYGLGQVSTVDNDGLLSPPRLMSRVSKSTPTERVRKVIANGAHTQAEIKELAKLGDEAVGEALVDLMLRERTIRCEVRGDGLNVYMCREEPKTPRTVETLSFSTIDFLHPVMRGK